MILIDNREKAWYFIGKALDVLRVNGWKRGEAIKEFNKVTDDQINELVEYGKILFIEDRNPDSVDVYQLWQAMNKRK